jgi:hypothetical protein
MMNSGPHEEIDGPLYADSAIRTIFIKALFQQKHLPLIVYRPGIEVT